MGGNMKHNFKKLTAAAVSAVMAALSIGNLTVFAESAPSEPTEVVLHFDLSDKDVSVKPDKDGNPQVIEDITLKPGDFVNIPTPELVKEGYYFSGWTEDGIRGFKPNEVFGVGDTDVTLTPVWSDENDLNYHNVNYKVVLDGEEIDTTTDIKQKAVYRKGDFVLVSTVRYQEPNHAASQLGWMMGDYEFKSAEWMIMGDENVVFTPAWYAFRTITYTVGDVDRVLGAREQSYEKIATTVNEVGGTDKFSRIGFKLIGWQCDFDGQFYRPYQKFETPDQDVTMTAVWEPKKFTVTFDPGATSSDKIRLSGLTDTFVTCPEINVTKSGYYFAGWSYLGETYQPGDDFRVYTPDGSSITATAIWKEGTKPDTDIVYGDADCDGDVKMNDAVLIMQALSNPDKYNVGGTDETALTEKGVVNADCYDPGSKLTPNDALAIQKKLLKVVELPYIPADGSEF